MKHLLLIGTLALLFVSCCGTKKMQGNQSEPTLEDVVKALQQEYTTALKKLSDKKITDIRITEAEIDLKITKAIAGSGEIKVLIFKPSKKITRTKTTSISYTLSEKESAGGGAPLNAKKEQLSDIIVEAATKFHDLKSTVGKLVKDNFVVDLVFNIENVNSAGLSFEVLGMSVDAGVEKTNSVEHELKLTFKMN